MEYLDSISVSKSALTKPLEIKNAHVAMQSPVANPKLSES
jgi:hypothetical protein